VGLLKAFPLLERDVALSASLHSNTVHSCVHNNVHPCHTRKVPHQGVFRINVARTYNLHSLSTIHTHFAQLAFTLSNSHSLCTNYSLSTQFTVTHTNYIHSAQLFNECKPSFSPHHFHLTGGSRRAAELQLRAPVIACFYCNFPPLQCVVVSQSLLTAVCCEHHHAGTIAI